MYNVVVVLSVYIVLHRERADDRILYSDDEVSDVIV